MTFINNNFIFLQQQFEDFFDKQGEQMLRSYVRDTGMLPAEKTFERQREISNVDDLSQVHHLTFNKRMKKLYSEMEKHVSGRSPVHIRTQWEGIKDMDHPDEPSQTAVRNTINVNTYHSKKTNLNIVMDSKFIQKGDKMEPVDPSFGLNFQMKY